LEGKLSVLQRKKGVAAMKNNKDSFKVIGIATIQLTEYLDGEPQELSAPLKACKSSEAHLNFTICGEKGVCLL
jgi:hypothetical protein